MSPSGVDLRLSEAIETYVDLLGRHHPISMKRMVKAMSIMIPDHGLTEKELSNLVGAKLVAMGCNINFNMNEIASDVVNKPRARPLPRPIDHGTPRSAR